MENRSKQTGKQLPSIHWKMLPQTVLIVTTTNYVLLLMLPQIVFYPQGLIFITWNYKVWNFYGQFFEVYIIYHCITSQDLSPENIQ